MAAPTTDELKILIAGRVKIIQTQKLIQRRLERIIEQTGPAAVRAMNLVAADLLERSANVAPILRGDLIRSGRITKTGSTKNLIRRQVSYGTDHAIFTHEGSYQLGPVSRLKPATQDGPVGRKYLARPFNIHAARYSAFVRGAAKRAAGLPGRARNL
ncbi:MAG: hypothetical protein V3U63_01650 [Gemmatimonadota bacterium]